MQNRPRLLLLHAVKRLTASSHREEEAWRFTSDVVGLMRQCGSSNRSRLNQWSQKDGKIIEIQGHVIVWMFKHFPFQLKGAIVSLSSILWFLIYLNDYSATWWTNQIFPHFRFGSWQTGEKTSCFRNMLMNTSMEINMHTLKRLPLPFGFSCL